MPRINIPTLTDHQECEILTGLTVDNVPRGNNFIGRTSRHRKGGNVWKPDDRLDIIFFCTAGKLPSSRATTKGANWF